MPVNIKVSQIKYKDNNGDYVGINGVAEQSTQEEIAAIEAKGAQTIASIPDDYTALSDQVKKTLKYIVPALPNNTKINITDTTITIPAYTRMYYGKNYIYRTPGIITIQRSATLASNTSEEQVVFDSATETFSCVPGYTAGLGDGKYLLCVLSKGLNGCSLSPDFVTWEGGYRYDNTLRADIVPPNNTKINITDTTITIPAYTRMYYRGTQIYRAPENGIEIQRIATSESGYSEERLLFNSKESSFFCLAGNSSAIDFGYIYVVCVLSKGLNGCSLSPDFVTWEGSRNRPDTSNIITDVNDQTDLKVLLENAAIIRRSDNYTNPYTPIKSRSNLFSLLHFSDVHGDGNAIKRILQFYKLYSDYIFDIIHTGDTPSLYFGDYNPFENTSIVGAKTILQTLGNHECWKEGDTNPHPYNVTEEEAYNEYFASNISEWNVVSPGVNKCYYYKDYQTSNLRLIVLDSIHYDNTQETWFTQTLNQAKNSGLRVVIASHYHAQNGNTGYTTGFNTMSINSVPDPEAGAQIDRLLDSAYDVVDSFIESGGEFVCWLTGHEHTDSVGVVNGHQNQIEIIISTAKCVSELGLRARAYGTKVQDLFNLFFVDGERKLIKIIRIGADADIYLRSAKTLCINYSTKQLISTN